MCANFLAVGDLHLRKSCPSMRIDDFFAVQERKLLEIFEIAKTNACRAIIFPGDIFDRSDAPHGLVEWAIRLFKQKCRSFCLFVFGQHDLRYHTQDKQNTPLGVLVAALESKAAILVPDNCFIFPVGPINVYFYGCSWGEKLPDELPKNGLSVLVMHRPITMTPLPWTHPDLLLAKDLVKKSEAKLFITGDNHTQFIARYKNGTVVNMGSVMRTTTAQIEHKPAVALISIEDNAKVKIDRIPLSIRRNVFDMEKIEEKEIKEEKIASFVAGLGNEFDPELKFLDNLQVAIKNSPQGVRAIFEEVLS